LTFISKFYPDANLVAPPPPYSGRGRPRVRGKQLPAPAQTVASTLKGQRMEVAWYGGGQRRVEVVTGTAHWYQRGRPLVALRWVFVRDLTGTHRDEYLFTTESTMSPRMVVETYTGRWNIETTFQEVRSYVRLETTRGWSRNTVLRVAPCLFGIYTIVAYLYAELPTRFAQVRVVSWPGKRDVTFSDAITAVRRWFWLEWIFAIPGHRRTLSKLPIQFRQMLLNGLAPAA